MKRQTFYLIIIISIVFFSCNSNTKSSNIVRKGYSGNVELIGDIESVTISHYNLESKFGEEHIGELKFEEKFIFNDAGNVIEQITYNPIGNPGYNYSTVKRFYNEQENVIKKIEFNEDTTFNKKTIYLYNTEGKLSEKKSYTCFSDNDDYHEWLVAVTKPKYNNDGKLSEVASYTSSGELHSKEVNTYNADGDLIERCSYNSNGNVEKKYTFSYDRKGNIIEQRKYNSEGELVEFRSNIYKNNTPIEMCIYSGDALKRKVISKYENGKNTEEINYLPNGDIEYIFVFIYDDMGNMTHRKLYEGNIKKPSQLTTWNITYR